MAVGKPALKRKRTDAATSKKREKGKPNKSAKFNRSRSIDDVDKDGNIEDDADHLMDGDSDASERDDFLLSDVEGDDHLESADDKRLRLAKSYLAQVKAEQDAAASDEEFDQDAVAHRLQQDVAAKSGKQFLALADALRGVDWTKRLGQCKVMCGHRSSVTSTALTGDESTMFSGGKEGCIVAWDVASSTVLWRVKHDKTGVLGHNGSILCLAASEDGKYLASGGSDRLIRIWDIAGKGKLLKAFRGHQDAITSLVFRLGSQELYSVGADRILKLWNLSEMMYMDSLFGHQLDVICIDALRRERAVTASKDRTVRVWKIAEESQMIFRGHQSSIDCVKYIDDEGFLTGSQDGSLAMWTISRKKPIVIKKHAHSQQWISALGMCHYSDLAGTGSGDGVVRLWKVNPDEKILEEIGCLPVVGVVNSLTIAPSGSFMVIGIGQEHRLGRWERIKDGKNSLLIVPMSVDEWMTRMAFLAITPVTQLVTQTVIDDVNQLHCDMNNASEEWFCNLLNAGIGCHLVRLCAVVGRVGDKIETHWQLLSATLHCLRLLMTTEEDILALIEGTTVADALSFAIAENSMDNPLAAHCNEYCITALVVLTRCSSVGYQIVYDALSQRSERLCAVSMFSCLISIISHPQSPTYPKLLTHSLALVNSLVNIPDDITFRADLRQDLIDEGFMSSIIPQLRAAAGAGAGGGMEGAGMEGVIAQVTVFETEELDDCEMLVVDLAGKALEPVEGRQPLVKDRWTIRPLCLFLEKLSENHSKIIEEHIDSNSVNVTLSHLKQLQKSLSLSQQLCETLNTWASVTLSNEIVDDWECAALTDAPSPPPSLPNTPPSTACATTPTSLPSTTLVNEALVTDTSMQIINLTPLPSISSSTPVLTSDDALRKSEVSIPSPPSSVQCSPSAPPPPLAPPLPLLRSLGPASTNPTSSKMPPIRLQAVTNATNTLWQHPTDFIKFDSDELLYLFSTEKSKSVMVCDEDKKPTNDPKSKQSHLKEAFSRAVDVFLNRFGGVTSTIDFIENLPFSKNSYIGFVDALYAIVDKFPDDRILSKINATPNAVLAEADLAIKQLAAIPTMAERVTGYYKQLAFKENLLFFKKRLESLKLIFNEFLQCAGFVQVLHVVFAFAQFSNGICDRHLSSGFKVFSKEGAAWTVSVLDRLVRIKAHNGKTTALDYLVRLICEKFPDSRKFYNSLPVFNATQIEYGFQDDSVKLYSTILSEFEAVRLSIKPGSLKYCKPLTKDATKDAYHRLSLEFISVNEHVVTTLQRDYDATNELFKRMIIYFNGIEEKITWDEALVPLRHWIFEDYRPSVERHLLAKLKDERRTRQMPRLQFKSSEAALDDESNMKGSIRGTFAKPDVIRRSEHDVFQTTLTVGQTPGEISPYSQLRGKFRTAGGLWKRAFTSISIMQTFKQMGLLSKNRNNYKLDVKSVVDDEKPMISPIRRSTHKYTREEIEARGGRDALGGNVSSRDLASQAVAYRLKKSGNGREGGEREEEKLPRRRLGVQSLLKTTNK